MQETFDSTWEIGVLMHEYYRVVKRAEEKLGKYTNEWCVEKERIEQLYCRAIELSCKTGAFVMPIDMAIMSVRDGLITDNDGHGYYLSEYGHRIGYMYCNTKFLESVRDKGSCFIEWYNK